MSSFGASFNVENQIWDGRRPVPSLDNRLTETLNGLVDYPSHYYLLRSDTTAIPISTASYNRHRDFLKGAGYGNKCK